MALEPVLRVVGGRVVNHCEWGALCGDIKDNLLAPEDSNVPILAGEDGEVLLGGDEGKDLGVVDAVGAEVECLILPLEVFVVDVLGRGPDCLFVDVDGGDLLGDLSVEFEKLLSRLAVAGNLRAHGSKHPVSLVGAMAESKARDLGQGELMEWKCMVHVGGCGEFCILYLLT